jgi:hypothetical protein
MDDPQINFMNPFRYGLFSGDENTDLILQGHNISIFGDIHTNAGLNIKAFQFESSGVCESVKGFSTEVAFSVKAKEFADNQAVIEMPDISEELIEDAAINNKLIEYTPFNFRNSSHISLDGQTSVAFDKQKSTFTTLGQFVVQDRTYYFDGNLTIGDSVKFIGNGIIIATGDINIYGSSFETTEGSAFIYSQNGGITVFTAKTDNINSIFYAPNGKLGIEGNSIEITGKVIAGEVRALPGILTIKSDFTGFDKAIQRAYSSIQIPTQTIPPTQEPTPVNIVKGIDLNGDKAVNISDVMILAAVFNVGKGDDRYVEAYDLNSDGAVNIADIMIIAAKFNTMV